MSRLVKIVDNKYVQIEEYRNPNICFNTNEYDDFENYCTLRETFEPFELFYENQGLKKQLEESKDNYNCLLKQKEQFEYIMSKQVDYQGQQKEFIKWLEDESKEIYRDGGLRQNIYKEVLKKYKKIIGDDNDVKNQR